MVKHFAGPRALQALAQRAVGINVFGTDNTFVGPCDCIQSAATAFDRPSAKDNADGHANRHNQQKEKGQQKGFQKRYPLGQGRELARRGGHKRLFGF